MNMNATALKTLLFLSLIYLFPLFGNSQDSQKILIVSTNGAKLTEKENSDSKVLKTLSKGDKVELLGVAFPNGTNGTERFRVRSQEIEGYISSYFIQPNAELEGKLISLKEIYEMERQKFLDEQKHINDSLERIRIKESQEYLERLKIDEAELIRKNDSIADLMLIKAKSESKAYFDQKKKENAQALSERKQKFIKKYGATNGEKIANRTIWIGMTEEMLLDSWGQPDDINSTVTRYSVRKQYVYGLGQYVYVENGVVNAWQN